MEAIMTNKSPKTVNPVGANQIVNRSPWRTFASNSFKLKEARRLDNLRKTNKRNAENREFARMVWRTAQHRKRHPEEQNNQLRDTPNVSGDQSSE